MGHPTSKTDGRQIEGTFEACPYKYTVGVSVLQRHRDSPAHLRVQILF